MRARSSVLGPRVRGGRNDSAASAVCKAKNKISQTPAGTPQVSSNEPCVIALISTVALSKMLSLASASTLSLAPAALMRAPAVRTAAPVMESKAELESLAGKLNPASAVR